MCSSMLKEINPRLELSNPPLKLWMALGQLRENKITTKIAIKILAYISLFAGSRSRNKIRKKRRAQTKTVFAGAKFASASFAFVWVCRVSSIVICLHVYSWKRRRGSRQRVDEK